MTILPLYRSGVMALMILKILVTCEKHKTNKVTFCPVVAISYLLIDRIFYVPQQYISLAVFDKIVRSVLNSEYRST